MNSYSVYESVIESAIKEICVCAESGMSRYEAPLRL